MKSRLTISGNQFNSIILIMLLHTFMLDVSAQTKADLPVITAELAKKTEDTHRVDALLDLSHYYIRQPNLRQIDLDSAALLKMQAVSLSKKLKYECGIGSGIVLDAEIVEVKGDKQTATKLLNEALVFFEKNNCLLRQAKTYTQLNYLNGNDDKGINLKLIYLTKALHLYKQLNLQKEVGTTLQELADINYISQKYDTSLLLLNEALQAFKQANHKDLQGAYSLYSIIYASKGDFPTALKYGLLAAKTAENLSDQSSQYCAICHRVGYIYSYAGDNEQAINWQNKARNIAIALRDTQAIELVSVDLAECFLIAGRVKETISLLNDTKKRFVPKESRTGVRAVVLLVRAYLSNGETEKAAEKFKKMLELHNSIPEDDQRMDELHLTIIDYLQKTNQYEKTYRYIDEYRVQTLKANNLFRFINLEELQYKSDSATGKFKSALQHYQQYKVYIDSLVGIEKQKELDNLNVRYQTEGKTKDIQLLKQNNQSKDALISKEKTTKKLSIWLAVLLFLLLALIYSRYLLKQRSTTRLQLKQEQINQQNEELKKLVNDKEWLLKEIHHRVKNNLQIVISLLNTQSAYLDNQAALDAIQNSQHRMHAISLIHQRLYQSDGMTTIDMKWYIRELVGYIKDCIDESERLTFNIELDDISLDIVQAIPLGLILNESITNAIKYAFPNGKQGIIDVSIKWMNSNTCQLVVADNGIGLPPDFDIQQSASLGMSLMYGLTEQLGGMLNLLTENGTKLLISFEVSEELKIGKAA